MQTDTRPIPERSQTSSLFRQSQHKRKIREKTRGIVHNCSDLFKYNIKVNFLQYYQITPATPAYLES